MAKTDTERPGIPAPLIRPLVEFMESHGLDRIDIRLDAAAPEDELVVQEVLGDNALPDSMSRDAGVMMVVKLDQ
jgi:hypothetical protein